VTRPKRKNIPPKVKAEVLLRQNFHCAECKTIFTEDDKIEFDHRPSIIMRSVNVEGTDYFPPQNDPNFIDALHKTPCHLRRTIGRMPGASTTVTTKGSDIWLKSKFSRLEGRTKKREAKPIPSRPFPKSQRGFGK
jgi:hypothetical protein